MQPSVKLSRRAALVPPSSPCSAHPRRKAAVYGWCLVALLLSLSGRLWAQNYVFQRQVGSEALGLVQFNDPIGVAVDGSGNLYVSDRESHRILKFSPTGNLLAK